MARELDDILSQQVNKVCADCHVFPVTHVDLKEACFLCDECADCHSQFPDKLGPVRPLSQSASLSPEDVTNLRQNGNRRNRLELEATLPFFYRRPYPQCPPFYRKEFVNSKYLRREFAEGSSTAQSGYNCLSKRGTLLKRLRDDEKTIPRLFTLDMNNNSLNYYIKDTDKTPKAAIDLEKMNTALLDSEVYKLPPFSMLINYIKDGATRNIFVSASEARSIIDWYNAIRCCKFHRMCLAISGMNEKIDGSEVAARLTQDVVICDWLEKTGPRATDSWRKRWVYILGRKLLYSDEPLSAYPKGEVFLGHVSDHFGVMEGSPENWKKHSGFCFTIMAHQGGKGDSNSAISTASTEDSCRKERPYVFMTQHREIRDKWVQKVREIINTPVSLEARKDASVMNSARVQSMRF